MRNLLRIALTEKITYITAALTFVALGYKVHSDIKPAHWGVVTAICERVQEKQPARMQAAQMRTY